MAVPAGFPDFVTTGTPVASVWGNQVAQKILDLDARLVGGIRASRTTVTTDASGFAVVAYGHTFPWVPFVAANLVVPDGGTPPRILNLFEGTTTTYAVFRVWTYTGIAVQNTSVTISWIASTGGL